jgi:hypothetical protein
LKSVGLEEPRENLAFEIGQLEDFARASNVVVFNKYDLQMVGQMIEEGGESGGKPVTEVPIDEPLGYIESSKAAWTALMKASKTN